jgi:hypothetical protein
MLTFPAAAFLTKVITAAARQHDQLCADRLSDLV